MNLEAACAYAEKHALQALFVQRAGETIFTRFAPGFEADTPHALYSGTKSFWGLTAVAAQADNLLDLDEPVGATFEEWRAGSKASVTLRMLLALTSGIGFGGLGNAVPSYEKALAVELAAEPGTRFTYGGIPLQVFGAVLARKLQPRGLSPHAYLYERILSALGLRVASWRTLKDGTQPLPTGAFASAREWAKYGRLALQQGVWNGTAIVPSHALAACFRGSAANPRYGLGWWLSPLPEAPDIAYASGAGGQAMYLLPAQETLIVKFAKSASFTHATFLRRLLT